MKAMPKERHKATFDHLHVQDRRRRTGSPTDATAPSSRALEAAGVEFVDENGGGPGVRLRKRQQKKT